MLFPFSDWLNYMKEVPDLWMVSASDLGFLIRGPLGQLADFTRLSPEGRQFHSQASISPQGNSVVVDSIWDSRSSSSDGR
ncbi:hypothetical protein TNCT_79211 [Trichonephila clavata]|uniref:Uncharacterized protein n=1 Tax=Trichonephila clavata TaxID=2740835 RepID=A0A8X6J2N3_TRICU|nr:hypothetical protein TNCT_79211 [Trichonephila clavata]